MKMRVLFAVLLLVCSCTKLEEQTSIGAFSENTHNQLLPYLYMFVQDARENGVDLGYVFDADNTIELKFARLNGAAGRSWTWKNDKKIKVWIDHGFFSRMDNQHRIELIYHELGHDILGLDHNEKSEIMVDGSVRDIPADALELEIKKLFK